MHTPFTAHPLKQEAFDQTDRLRCPVTRQLQNTAQFQTPLRDKAHKWLFHKYIIFGNI